MALHGKHQSSLAQLPLLPQGDRKGPIPTQHLSRPYKDYDQSGNYLLYVRVYYLFFLLFIEYAAHMSHFASYFLAQQLICCVRDCSCKSISGFRM
jgi:hypothetical protein